MKKEAMRKYTLLGLVLIAASAVTAAVLPKNEEKKAVGMLAVSDGGLDPTCTQAGMGAQCTDTTTSPGDGPNGTGSRTTEDGDGGTSLMTATDGVNMTHTGTTNPADTHTSLS